MAQLTGGYHPDGLNGLLQNSGQANAYYASLPGYVQDMIQQRRQNIQSEDELRRYAENILQGDK